MQTKAFGYVRVSCKDQNVDRQVKDMLAIGINERDIFIDKQYFQFTAGSNLDGTRTKKSEVISYALKECRLEAGSNAVMIGDRKYDIIGAKETGIDSIGVLYGYGSRLEMEKEGPTHIAATVGGLRRILL